MDPALNLLIPSIVIVAALPPYFWLPTGLNEDDRAAAKAELVVAPVPSSPGERAQASLLSTESCFISSLESLFLSLIGGES